MIRSLLLLRLAPVCVLLALTACVVPETTARLAAERPAAVSSSTDSPHSPILARPPVYPFGVAPLAPRVSGGPLGAADARARRGDEAGGYADCDSARLYALQGAALAGYVATLSGTCLNGLVFDATEANWRLMAPDNMRAVAYEAQRRAQGWDGQSANGLWPLAVFLKAGYYVQSNHPDKVGDYDAALGQLVLQAPRALLQNAALWQAVAPDPASGVAAWYRWTDISSSVSESLILLDSVRQSDTLIALATDYFRRYTPAAKATVAQYGLFSLQTALYNLHLSDGFAARVAAGQADSLVSALAGVLGGGRAAFVDDLLYRNTVRETGRFMLYAHTEPEAEQAMVPLLTQAPLSADWAEAVYALKNFGHVPCERYRLCNADARLRQALFPRHWRFDDGALIFDTALGLEDVLPLYYAMKQVRAQYHRVIGSAEPVSPGRTPVLHMVIYANPDDYRAFQPLLNNLSADNGGIYIERDGTFYTFQRRVPQDSSLTMEELVRHEYVHYLNGRFLEVAQWGEPPFYNDDRRMPWFDEGMAEFLAWSTSRQGIKVRGHTVGPVAAGWPGSFREPASTMRSAYADGWDFYNQSALWFHYLYRQEPAQLLTAFAAVRANDAAAFDAWVVAMGADRARSARFRDFVARQTQLFAAGQLDDTSTPKGTAWVEQAQWQEGDVARLGAAVRSVLPMDCGAVYVDAGSLLPRFSCRSQLWLGASSLADGHARMESLLNQSLQRLYAAGANNFEAVNCSAFDYDLAGQRVSVACEGPLAAPTLGDDRKKLAHAQESS
jgi:microbial collagenase